MNALPSCAPMSLLRVRGGCEASAEPVKRQGPVVLRPRSHRPARSRIMICMSVWQELKDAANGRPYYWNTSTNETRWDKPEELSTAQKASAPASEASPVNHENSSSPASQAASSQQLLDVLQQAYQADGTGMAFWEAARSHRKYGVFEPTFTDFLADQIAEAPNEPTREKLLKIRARLSNPLLKQPAPFEF